MLFPHSYDKINFRLVLSTNKWYFKLILFTQEQFLLCWHSRGGLSTSCGRSPHMPRPQRIIKHRQTICKKNMQLDHPELLSAFSQLQRLPPATRESLNQKKHKGEAQRFSDTFSLLHKENTPFSSVRTNYELYSRRKANYSLPSNLSCSPQSLAVVSVRSWRVFYSRLLSCSSSIRCSQHTACLPS